jgi:hypothetical protein
VGVGDAQVEGTLGEAFSRGLTVERAVGLLVILGFDPTPEPGIEVFQRVGRIDYQAGFKIHLQRGKPALLLALGPGRTGFCVAEPYTQSRNQYRFSES